MNQKCIILVVVLSGFSGSLDIKCVSVNTQSFMVRPMLIDLNHDELHYYPAICFDL